MTLSRSVTAVIFGSTGAIGTSLAQILSKSHPEWTILCCTRNPDSPSRLASLKLPNVTMVKADPFDPVSVMEVSQNCNIMFSCIGFDKYEAKYWSKHWPLVVENLLNALNASKSRRLVFCDNLYAYGAGHEDQKITTSTATVSANLTGKPNIRSLLHQKFQTQMKEYPGALAVVGGADFFGPHVTKNSFLGDTVTGKIIKKETALAVGSVSQIHDFCFTDDFANALAVVSTQDKAYGKFWICPHSIHEKSLQMIANDVAVKAHGDKAGLPVNFSILNKFLLYLMSPFMSFASEMIEMLSFWSQDYRVDDSEFCQTFNVKATPYDDALQALVKFYKEQDN